MRKLLSVVSISTILLATPALAVPYSFSGSKGTYTTDADRGTYRGCLFSGGCITLGRKYFISCEPVNNDNDSCEGLSWKRGEYTYFVLDGNIWVSKNGKTIFTDSSKR